MNPTKTVIITGGNSGLGYECAKVLATQHPEWHIIIASRSQARIDEAVAQLKTETAGSAISAMVLDLGSFASIRSFAEQVSAQLAENQLPPLQAIICNAGLSPRQNRQTSDGIDLIFGVNHLGHYLLVHLLSNQLNQPGRIVFVSSGTHVPEHKLARRLGIPVPKYTTAQNLAYPDNAADADRINAPPQRYSTSKLCNMLCAYEFSRQYQAADMDVAVFGIDPGLMPGTGLAREAPAWLLKYIFVPIVSLCSYWVAGIRLPYQSGQDLARLITDDELTGKTALYFDGHEEIRSSDDSYDLDKAIDLWNTSSELSGLREDETVLPIWIG
ncbi:MAG: SDR family NAD(P)-dependent oxidoreductase [Chloroflexota bacterium]